jgi:hypothetical protein
MRKIIVTLTSALALISISCESKTSLYPVAGSVFYKGEPASGATVFFYRQSADIINEHTIMGVVNGDGSFELVCGSLGTGAPPGEYDVVIEWRTTSGQSKGQPQRGLDKLKGRYADPKHPLLHATVEAKTKNQFAFELLDEEHPKKKP